MAVRFKNDISYVGAVLNIESRMWMDGMLEEIAVCWDAEQHDIKRINFGYYGIDGTNLAGGVAEIDATPETWRQVINYLKPSAVKAYVDGVIKFKNEIAVGTHVEVVKGRKVPKGTKLEVFWVGEKPTFRSRNYSWMNETETIAGCYDTDGNKVWIKAEYLKNVDPIQSPNAKERKKAIHAYIDKMAKSLGAPWVAR